MGKTQGVSTAANPANAEISIKIEIVCAEFPPVADVLSFTVAVDSLFFVEFSALKTKEKGDSSGGVQFSSLQLINKTYPFISTFSDDLSFIF
jgi:hypothetical protein